MRALPKKPTYAHSKTTHQPVLHCYGANVGVLQLLRYARVAGVIPDAKTVIQRSTCLRTLWCLHVAGVFNPHHWRCSGG